MGAAIDYLATLLGLFKTLFDSPQLMITTIEQQTATKSEKGELIRSLSSVYNNINTAPFVQPYNQFGGEPDPHNKFRPITKALMGMSPMRTSLKVIAKDREPESPLLPDSKPNSLSYI